MSARSDGGVAAALAQVADLLVPLPLEPVDVGGIRYIPVVPQNARELQEWTYTFLGVWIGNAKVCEQHCAPLDAYAAAFFAVEPRMVWWASRGYGGKTFMLAALVLAEAILLGADVTLLGGSLEQSLRVSRYFNATPNLFLSHAGAPTQLLATEPTKRELLFQNGGRVLAIPASERSIRGLHPARLRADELDAFADPQLWESAQGLAMPQAGVADQTLASSTWHLPNGPMTQELLTARERGWPIFTWCWKEAMAGGPPPDTRGWLLPEVIERKKTSVSAIMWETEYNLQEPMVYGDRVYVSFGPENVSENAEDIPHTEWVVGMDFNRCPMTAVIGVETADGIDFFDEISLWNATTETMAEVLVEKCEKTGRRPENVTIFPDASGRFGTTKSGQTDFTVLESFGFVVEAPLANPPLKERINTVNSALKTASGRHRLRFHPRCKEAIRGISQLPYRRGTNIPDKSTGLDHFADAVGYPTMALIPLTDTSVQSANIYGV